MSHSTIVITDRKTNRSFALLLGRAPIFRQGSTSPLFLMHVVWMIWPSAPLAPRGSPGTTNSPSHCLRHKDLFRGGHTTRKADQSKAWDLYLERRRGIMRSGIQIFHFVGEATEAKGSGAPNWQSRTRSRLLLS